MRPASPLLPGQQRGLSIDEGHGNARGHAAAGRIGAARGLVPEPVVVKAPEHSVVERLVEALQGGEWQSVTNRPAIPKARP